MKAIKTYSAVDKKNSLKSFGISRMEEIFKKRRGFQDLPHRHDFFTVLFIREGVGKHIIDFNEFVLSENQVYFIGPDQVHQLIENKPSVGYSMVFSADFLLTHDIPFPFVENLSLFHNYGHCPPLTPRIGQAIKLEKYCEEMVYFFHSKDKYKDEALGALIKLFLINCNNMCTLPLDEEKKKAAVNGILRKFKSLVDKHYTTMHSTSEYAKKMNLSPDYLNRTVKSLIGKTAKEYIQSRITIGAKRMLCFSDLSAKEVGYQLGFSEPANFSAFFKKCTGSSPVQFKKNFKP